MVLCRYFQQGSCRFGANCRFEHSLPSYNSNINIVQQQQLQSYRQQQPGQLSSNDFFLLVKQDLEAAERSGQWLLSCYCPYPSKSAALPGLDDHSPEELRCLMYEAQSTGNVESSRQHIEKLKQEAQLKMNIFKSQSPECKAILERVRSGPASPSSNPFQTNTTGGSIFGGSSVEASPVKTNMFGGSATPQASVFSGGSVVPAQANPFGAATASAPQSSIFGGGSAATNVNHFMVQPSMFGGGVAPAPAATGPIFGGAYSGQPSLFGGQPGASSVGTGSVFGGGSSTMNSFSFAAAAQDQGIISHPPVPSMQTPTIGGIFGGGAQPPVQAVAASPTVDPAVAQVVAPVANPFGTPTQTVKTMAPQVDMGAHSNLNDLTEEEKAEFLAPTFSRGRIPLCPPPTQLCV